MLRPSQCTPIPCTCHPDARVHVDQWFRNCARRTRCSPHRCTWTSSRRRASAAAAPLGRSRRRHLVPTSWDSPEAPGARLAVLDTGMAARRAPVRRPSTRCRTSHLHFERPDADGDQVPSTQPPGHGTFIVGLIDLVTPGCDLTVEKVLSSYGEGDEVAIVLVPSTRSAGTGRSHQPLRRGLRLCPDARARRRGATRDPSRHGRRGLRPGTTGSAGRRTQLPPPRRRSCARAVGPNGPAPFTSHSARGYVRARPGSTS